MKNHTFSTKAILRLPLRKKTVDFDWEEIQKIFKDERYREALFIASPMMIRALETFEENKKFGSDEELTNLKTSLYKYCSRLSNRCTPFGLWASISVINIGETSNIDISEGHVNRITKFDMFFLSQLVKELLKKKTIREALKYYPNNSLYQIKGGFRYVEYYFKKEVRSHKISEVKSNEFLLLLFEKSKKGISFNDLINVLSKEGIAKKDAEDFINQLIDGQFLMHELDFNITGQDYLDRLLSTFSETRFKKDVSSPILSFLKELKEKILILDKGQTNSPKDYIKIFNAISEKIPETNISKLFQVDTYRFIPNAQISYKTIRSLRSAARVVNRLQSKTSNSILTEFKKSFLERYEEYEQPLTHVLDPDLGIGYGNSAKPTMPLIENLKITTQNRYIDHRISWDDKKSFLLKKIIEANKKGSYEIVLGDDDVNQFDEDETLYPDSVAIFFSIFNEGNREKIKLNAIVGPSASRMYSRFSHLNETVYDLCKEAHQIEKQQNPNAMVAEILHIPQARTGNILYRKSTRDYEIPYLAKSLSDDGNQIPIEDILVSVKNNKVVLRSKKNKKQIIPRLGSAHNYSVNSLPIYHFLSDLQDQDESGIIFNWGDHQYEFDFLPRLSYKNVVISRASWILDKKKIENILLQSKSDAKKAVYTFLNQNKVPYIINFTNGDNEVTLNFENEISRKVFLTLIKNKRQVVLKEFLFSETTVTQDFCNEFIVPAYRKPKEYKSLTFQKNTTYKPNELSENSFSVGDEWLYFKFYCGEQVLEKFLKGPIAELIDELNEKQLVEKWFFIRYKDRLGNHLRLRLKPFDKNLGTTIAIVKKRISPYEKELLVWKVATDTYLREIQRYGAHAIDKTESLYHKDSEATLNFLKLMGGSHNEKMRWLFSLISIDFLLTDFGYGFEEKSNILKIARLNFSREFGRKGQLNKQVNTLFKNNEKEIDYFLDLKNAGVTPVNPLVAILRLRSKKYAKDILYIKSLSQDKKLPENLSVLVLSYMHLICNRIFIAKQRIHEMVVYDMLYKYYMKRLNQNS